MLLSDIKVSFERYQKELGELLADLSEEQLLQAEKPGKWSINQVMQHLLLANTTYLKQLKSAAEKQDKQAGKVSTEVKFSWTGKLFRHFVDVKVPFKVPAPGIFLPKKMGDKLVLQEFIQFQADLIRVCEELEQAPINQIKIHSPLSKLVIFRAGELLSIISEHQYRHLTQMKRVKEGLSKTKQYEA